MRGRPVLHGSFDPATMAFSTDEADYPLPVLLAPARTRCLCCGGLAAAVMSSRPLRWALRPRSRPWPKGCSKFWMTLTAIAPIPAVKSAY